MILISLSVVGALILRMASKGCVMTRSCVTRLSEQKLQVAGIIDFDNALDMCQQGERLISKAANQCEIDFSGVTRGRQCRAYPAVQLVEARR